MLENIVRTFTVSIGDDKDAWTSTERSASGTYQAAYKKQDAHRFTKSKSDFVAAQSTPILRGAKISSNEMIELNGAKNWVARMTVDESLKSAGGTGPSISISNRASLELLVDAVPRVAKNRWHFEAAEPQSTTSPSDEALAKMSPEEARRKLIAGLSTLDATEQGRSKVIHELRDLLRVDGSVPKTLLEQMKTQELSDRTRADLYLALELAATEEAQAALAEVITQPDWSTRDAMRATVALAGINEPSQQTLDVLWETAYAERGQLSTTATYSLGSVGSRMKAASNPEYLALRDSLLNQAYSAGEASQRVTFIYSLGNTRDADIAPEVGGFLQDDDPSIRRAAALSLGLMQSTYSSDTLISQFEQESDSQVRGAIAESLNRLPITDSSPVMASLNNAIRTEADESARYAMANFLATNLNKHPHYESDLRELMRKEPSKAYPAGDRQRAGKAMNTALAAQTNERPIQFNRAVIPRLSSLEQRTENPPHNRSTDLGSQTADHAFHHRLTNALALARAPAWFGSIIVGTLARWLAGFCLLGSGFSAF